MANRVYHNFLTLEEYTQGMWRIVRGEERKRYIAASADLMLRPDDFFSAMVSAIDQWPRSCEHNLTAENMNRIAWLGHAGCCVAIGSPEDCTRAGWYYLDDDQMEAANQAAARALTRWAPTHDRQMTLAL